MEKQQSDQVVLYGTWHSFTCKRVELALKLKGINNEYAEEDMPNISDLLHYNPVHKDMPVLVHNGKAITESHLILEYIDEYWHNASKLLPEDPHLRTKTRYWANFCDQKLMPSIGTIIVCKGKEREQAIKEFSGLLSTFEAGIAKDFLDKFPLDGGTLRYLDIVVGTIACNYRVFEEVVAIVIDPNKNAPFLSWVATLNDCPLMKETFPPHDKLVITKRRQKYHFSLM